MAKLMLSLLGGFHLSIDKIPVLGFESDKVRALLAYLAIEADRTHRRETLCGLLWPDKAERLARRSLSQSLYNLQCTLNKQQSAPPFLHVEQQYVQFNRQSDHWLDVNLLNAWSPTKPQFGAGAESTSHLEYIHRAVNLYSG